MPMPQWVFYHPQCSIVCAQVSLDNQWPFNQENLCQKGSEAIILEKFVHRVPIEVRTKFKSTEL